MKCFIYILMTINLLANEKILIVSSYSDDYWWQAKYKKALIQELDDSFDLYFFNMNTKLLPVEEFEKKAIEAKQYILEVMPDLIILGDDNALSYLYEDLIYTDIPLVFLGINANIRNYFVKRPDNVTGVLERPQLKRATKLLKNTLTPMDNVLFIFDDSTTSRSIFEEEFNFRNTLYLSGVTFDLYSTNNWDKWTKNIREAHLSYDAIVIGTYGTLKDNGRAVTDIEAIEYASANSKVPVFAVWEGTVGKGKATGGLVVSATQQGLEAAKIVRKILIDGIAPIKIFPVTPQEDEVIFSQYELNRWHLKVDEERYPEVIYIE